MHIHKLALIAPLFLVASGPSAPPALLTPIKPTHSISVPQLPAFTPLAAIIPPPAPPPPPLSFPYSPPGTFANDYAPMNCTSYVAGRVRVPNSWGNAATWAIRAEAEGITVSATPAQGAIAQHGGGFGHVALVVGISPDGSQVLVDEQNYDFMGSIREAWHNTSEFVYIYA